jgi:hypothetical protein
MKIILGMLLVSAMATAASAQYLNTNRNSLNSGLSSTGSNSSNHYVSPHLNSNGGMTSGHYQTNPNNTQLDNYGTRGNVNPYTGAVGSRGARF